MQSYFTTTLIALLIAPAVAAEPAERTISVSTTTVGKMGHCDSQVIRQVSACDEQGRCETLPLTDDVTFRVPRGGSFTIAATASGTSEAGLVYGDASVDRFSGAISAIQLVQTLEVGRRCSYSFSYDIAVR